MTVIDVQQIRSGRLVVRSAPIQVNGALHSCDRLLAFVAEMDIMQTIDCLQYFHCAITGRLQHP